MVKKGPYIVAALVSLTIFIIGFLIGSQMLDLQLENLKFDMDRNELELRNIQLELIFLETLGNDTYCPYLKERINNIEKRAWELGNKLVDPQGFDEKYFDSIKRRYSISMIEDWLFTRKLNEGCETNRTNVLYFFQVASDVSESQGYVLDYLVKKDENNLHIFAIDKDLDEPAIQILVKSFNITQAPAIVLGNRKYEGFRTKEEMIALLCGFNGRLSFCS